MKNRQSSIKLGGLCLILSHLLFAQTVSAEQCPSAELPLSERPAEIIEFNKEHGRTLRTAISILEQRHYKDVAFNDELSQAWLDKFIEFLDPSKSFLLQSDIKRIKEQYALQLDNASLFGNLSPAKEIYELYRERATAQLTENLTHLEDSEFAFDFTTDRTLPTDRDDYDWPQTQEEAYERWDKQLTLSLLNLKLSGKDEADARTQLVRRYRTQLTSLNQQKTQQVLDLYMNALGRIYDPHTDYFSPRQSENFEINMSLSLEGIGAVLQRDDEHTKVVSVVPGGPAAQQGELAASDRIVAIGEGETCDFVDVVGWRLDEVVDRIRGEKGTTVRLQVIPAKEDDLSAERKVIKIVRDKVNLEENAAKGEVIEVSSLGQNYKIGVIDVPSFYLDDSALRRGDPTYRSTTKDTRAILDDFAEQGVDGVIIDLRQNGGGSLIESATMTDLFIDKGPVVQIKDQNNRVNRGHRARSKAYYGGPLVVLVDRLSASASEIFAGAIQDYKRGLILGSQTFGKGTVQSVQPLPSGRLKLTESKFYRISGDSTQHKGVIPDIQLPNLYDPEDIGESAYDSALVWDQIRGIPHLKYQDFTPYLDNLKRNHAQRLESEPDLKYLLATIDLADQRRNIDTISLNEEARLAEREKWEQREEELKSSWIAERPDTPDTSDEDQDTPSNSELPDTDSSAEADDDESSEDELDIANTLLMEAGRIFADFLTLQNQNNGPLAFKTK